MSIVSNNLKYLRRLNGLTQEQFSRRIGIKRSLLGAYEEARANPNYDNLNMISKVFGVTVDQLIKQDLRRIRQTPDLSFQTDVLPETIMGQFGKEIDEPKPIADVLDKYFIEPELPKSKQISTDIPVDKTAPFIETTKQAPTLSFSANGIAFQSITLVISEQDYLHNLGNNIFIQKLPIFQLPLQGHGIFRAFFSKNDFNVSGAILVGKQTNDLFQIQDGSYYILVLREKGIVFRRAYNQLKTRGTILVSSDLLHIPPTEIQAKDIQEIWELKTVVSHQLPEPQPDLEKLRRLLDEVKLEVDRVMK